MRACAAAVVLAVLPAVVPTAAADQRAQSAPTTPATPAAARSPRPRSRWLDVQAASLSLRYRFSDASDDRPVASSLQHQEALRFRVKADPAGRYSLHTGIFSGSTFTAGWNNTGVGTGAPTGRLHVKQLFLDAQPFDGVEVQAGSLYVWRGESSEITSYDNDGYVTGARLAIVRPDRLFVDELQVTQAHLGDLDDPNVFHRIDRLGALNYRQVGVVKALDARAAASADYTVETHARTLRGGVRIALPARATRGAVDAIRVDGYRRLNGETAGGFSVTGEKRLRRRAVLGAGFSTIDPEYGGLNSDRYGTGKRLFATGLVALSRTFALNSYVTRAVSNDFPIGTHLRIDVGLVFNVLAALEHAEPRLVIR